jgi:hypothetical protein
MWPGDDLDEMLMDAARALDAVRDTRLDGCQLLVAALQLGEEPPTDHPWTPDQLPFDRMAQDDYAEAFGMLRD